MCGVLISTCSISSGRSKQQYAPKKQSFVKKGSWQQDNWSERKKARHVPPSKSRQQEVLKYHTKLYYLVLLISVGCAVEKSTT